MSKRGEKGRKPLRIQEPNYASGGEVRGTGKKKFESVNDASWRRGERCAKGGREPRKT